MIDDDKHNFLKCTDCNKELADVVITRDCDDIAFSYLALCPFCNSQSEEKTIKGLVHIGSVPGTLLRDIKHNEDKAIIYLAKER